MSESRITNPFLTEDEVKNASFSDAVAKYVFHWPLFILSVGLFTLLGFLYLRYTPPSYAVNSVLLIKDDKKGTMPPGEDLLNELDLFGSSKTVENEIEILKSKTLMRKVVDRLNLSITLKATGIVKSSDLYANRSTYIDVIQVNNEYFGKSFTLTFPTSSTYKMIEETTGFTLKGYVNVIQRNKLGVYQVKRSTKSIALSRSPITVIIQDPVSITDYCLRHLSVSLASKQSTVLSLAYEATVPERGADILNTLIQVYNEAALIDKNKTTQSTIDFIDERLKLISGELVEVEKDVEGFKSTRGLTDISSDAGLFLESVKTNDLKLNEINLQLSVIEDIRSYINSTTYNEKLPSTLGINDPVLLGQISQLSELQLRKDQLLSTTTESNPLVQTLLKQIETTRSSIKTAIANISKSLIVSRSKLEENNSKYQGSIKKIPGQERQLISIKRQQAIKESLYLYLLQKKEEAALSYASTVADSRIVDPAYFSKVPIKPRPSIIYLGSFIFGILIPIGYLYGKDLLNNKLNSSEDITALTKAPILGEIVYDEGGPIVVHSGSRSVIAEQFRSIRTNMQFLQGKDSNGLGKVTLFTSGISGEGKTFVASNLATAFAISGRKTVLLELDLRKPKVSKYLSLNNTVGLSNYLIGKVQVEDIIKASGVHSNFFVIGSGPIPPNPSELVLQDEIDELIGYLRQNYDEIIIDSPPIGLVTDAQILARIADVTIYVVRQGVTFKNEVDSLERLFRQKKFPRLNIIFNGIKVGGSYKYGYGYGYGYYSDERSNGQKRTFRSTLKEIVNRL